MTRDPRRLTRRTALAGCTAALGSIAMAACGEPVNETAISKRLGSQLTRDLERASTRARTTVDRRPRPQVAAPPPNAQTPITVAMFPSAEMGASLFAQLLNSLTTARERSKHRYAYQEASLDFGKAATTFSLSSAVDAVVAASPDLILYLQIDQDDLITNNKLLELDPFLASDSTVDPDSFWPNLLDVGRHDGTQYGLPAAASPNILLFNRALAEELQINPPESDRISFNADVFMETVNHFHVVDQSDGGIGSLGLLSTFSPEPNSSGDYAATPSPIGILLSAVGDLRGPRHDFEPLTTEAAIATARFLKAWVHDHRFAITDNRSLRPYWQERRIGLYETYLAFTRPDIFVSYGALDVYPFPNMGTGKSPSLAHAMLGVLADAKNPELAYDAMRYLATGLNANAVLPATRLTSSGIAARVPQLPPEGAGLVADQMSNAVYPTVSRREIGIITNGIVGDIIFGTSPPEQGMRDIADRLRDQHST